MLLKLRASLTCFQAYFLPGQAKDLSAPWYFMSVIVLYTSICLTLRCKVLTVVYNIQIHASSYGLCALCNIYKKQ